MKRFVVRPRKVGRTPRRLRDTLGYLRSFKYPNRKETPKFSWVKDLLIAVPREGDMDETTLPPSYPLLRMFYTMNKLQQRVILSQEGVPTPLDFTAGATKYVSRPLRHARGSGFEVVDFPDEAGDLRTLSFDQIKEYNQENQSRYLSPLFHRTHEYRIILHKGIVVATMLKRCDGQRVQESAWNADETETRYTTVRNPFFNDTATTEIYTKLSECEMLSCGHLLGIDVLLDYDHTNPEASTYAVCEVNFAPSITICENIQELDHAILSAQVA
jgi:hypothetical protein